jgi:hypothetical protein
MRAILLSACVLALAACGGARKEGFISTAVLIRSLRDAGYSNLHRLHQKPANGLGPAEIVFTGRRPSGRGMQAFRTSSVADAKRVETLEHETDLALGANPLFRTERVCNVMLGEYLPGDRFERAVDLLGDRC